MHLPPLSRTLVVAPLLLLAACGKEGVVEPAGGAFSLGQSVSLGSGREVRVVGGPTTGEYAAVVVNTALDSTSRAGFTLTAGGIAAPASLSASASRDRLDALVAASDARGHAPSGPARDQAFEDRVRDAERALTPRFGAARTWNAARVPVLPRVPTVGEIIRINVNPVDACTNPTYHGTRVVAVGSRAIILADTLNPRNGFSTADYQRFAARFDTLVYPLDVAAFGEPTDIDGNGHVVIVFTRAVNELTPFLANSFVGGLTHSRDLFPQAGSARAVPCAASNEGEYFYMLAPDPTGTINGNRRSVGFVDTTTTGVIAHELVHLINSSRKLYVNTTAPSFEEKWLDEGLAHMAEELLFYRESGLGPRQNLSYATLVSAPRIRNAYLADMGGNAGRYRVYLENTTGASPYAAGDSLATRGAIWSFLRYLADRAGSSDGTVFKRLVDNTAVGIANLRSVFGNDVGSLVRDWSVSHAVDDVLVTDAVLQQQSWNWHLIYGGINASSDLYPLQVTTVLASTSYTGTIVAGGASYYRFAVPSGGTATLTLGAQSGAASSNLQLVIVRIK